MARTNQTSRKGKTQTRTAGTPQPNVVYVHYLDGPPHDAGTINVVNSGSLDAHLQLGNTVQTVRTCTGRKSKVFLEGGQRADTLADSELPIEDYCANYHTIRASTTRTIPLATKVDPTNLVSWYMVLHTFGLKWREDANPTLPKEDEAGFGKIEVVPSGTYHLLDDEDNMPLTEAQFHSIQSGLLKSLQQSSPYGQLWSLILNYVQDDGSLSRRSPEQLTLAYEISPHHHSITIPYWQRRYALVRLEANPNKEWVVQADLNKELTPGGRARIDIYWRALERRPGGSNDVHTVCYTLDCATRTVSVRRVQNSDGSLDRSEYRPANLSVAIQQEDTDAPFPEMLKALRALGPGDSECTILDTISEDSEDYDTTWTSHEILVFLPRPWSPATHARFSSSFQQLALQLLLVNQRAQSSLPTGPVHRILQFAAPLDYLPVTRLHQKRVMGSQWHRPRDPDPEVPPTTLQQAALTKVQDLIGMGRVNTWTDAGDGVDPCRAEQDEELDTVRDDSATIHHADCTLHPFYFDFPARNVAGSLWRNGGTSTDW